MSIDGQRLQRCRKVNRYLRKRVLRCSDQAGADLLKTVFPQAAIEVGPITGCQTCGNLVACTCSLAQRHKHDCRFLKAARLSVELACSHGFQACPECDSCDCGAGQVNGVR